MAFSLKQFTSRLLCSRCLARTFAYRSVYHPDNLYGPNNVGTLAYKYPEKQIKIKRVKFDDEIPVKELDLKYSKSSGAGGQHVNRALTKVQARFHVESATWLSDEVKTLLLEKSRKNISKRGELIVECDKSRYQLNNVASCLQKIRDIIEDVIQPPDTSKEDRIKELNSMEHIEAAHRKRLREKKLRSYTKFMRSNFD